MRLHRARRRRLTKDGDGYRLNIKPYEVWVINSAEPMKPRASNNDVLKSELIAKNATGDFTPEIKTALAADPGLVVHLASLMLERHFPESLHQDIVSAIGLSLEASTGPAPTHFEWHGREVFKGEARHRG